jgi:hypothetical protein
MFLAVLILMSTFAFADVTCATAAAVIPNGVPKQFDFVAASTTNFYAFKVSAGHSYSVTVDQEYDPYNNTDLTIQVNSEATTCTTAVVSPTVTTNAEPQIPGAGLRESFTAAANGTYSVSVNDGGPNGRYITVNVADTTKYNPRWSTFAHFTTQWGFQNTSNQAINVKLVATGFTNCAFSGTLNFSVPANGEVFKDIAAQGEPSNPNAALQTNCTANGTAADSGYAVITNDGAPGALLMDAFFVFGTDIVPSVVQAVREN